MRELARLTRRGRRGQVTAVFLTVLFSTTILGALGLLFETGLRGRVSTGEYAEPPLLIGAAQTLPVKEDVDIAVPGRALLPSTLANEIAVAMPSARVVVDQVVPAELAGPESVPVAAHPAEALQMANFSMVAGHAPGSMHEVALPRDLADDQSVGLGDEVQVAFGGKSQRFVVAGLTSAAGSDVDVPDIYLLASDLQVNNALDDRVAAIGVWPGSESTDELHNILAGSGAILWDEERRGELEVVRQGKAKETLTSAAGAFGGLTVIVTLFTVMALTSLQVRERSRELAMLRVVGATYRQVSKLLVGEIRRVAVAAAIVGGAAGPLLGAGLVGLGQTSGVLPAGLAPVVSALPIVIPMLITVLAAESAVRVATRRVIGRGSPLPGLRGADDSAGTPSRARLATGLALLSLGGAMAVAPWVASTDATTGFSGLSSLVIAVSAGLLSPWVVRAAARVAQRPAALDAAPYLAISNVKFRAARVAGVVAPAALGVTLSCTQLFVGASAVAVADGQIESGQRADLVVNGGGSGIDDATAALIAEVPGIQSVDPVATGTVVARGPSAESAWQVLPVLAADPAGLGRYADLDPRHGHQLHLAPGEVALGEQGSDILYAEIGDVISVVLGDGRTAQRRVAAIYRRGLGFGELVLPLEDVLAATPAGRPTALVVTFSPDISEGSVTPSVSELVQNRPGMRIATSPALAHSGSSEGHSALLQVVLLMILWGYIAIAVVSSMVVGNLGRRTELTLLEAVGATPAQRRHVARYEAAFIAATACVVGVAAAVPGAAGLMHALSNGERSIPVLPLGGMVVVVTLTFTLVLGATVLSIRPARR